MLAWVAAESLEVKMLPGMELMGCTDLAVPREVMHHVVRVESSYNPFAIGVVGGRLIRQPRNLPEAVATAQMLEDRGFNFSLGLAQVNRYNLKKYGLETYEKAFQACPNLSAGSRILAECYSRSKQDWGDSLSCYYSGNFVTGYRHGYVQKVFASMEGSKLLPTRGSLAIEVTSGSRRKVPQAGTSSERSSTTVTSGQQLVSLRSGSDSSSRASSTRDPEQLTGDANSAAAPTVAPRDDARAVGPEAAFQARQQEAGSGSTISPEQRGSNKRILEAAVSDAAFVF